MNKTIISIAAIVIILVLAGGGFVLLQNKKTQPTAQESNNKPAATTNEPSTSSSSQTYKDGSYTAEGDYITHGGPESISVSLTLKGGVIEDVNVTSQAKDAMSTQMQGQFISGYKPLVMGKKIDDVNLSRVSGSSLTPLGFNDAISKIKSQAKS